MKHLRTPRRKRHEFVLQDLDSPLIFRNVSPMGGILGPSERQFGQGIGRSRQDSAIRSDIVRRAD